MKNSSKISLKNSLIAFVLLISSLSSFAAPKVQDRLDYCERQLKKDGGLFALSQIWFDAGENFDDAKYVQNYTFKEVNEQLTYDYSFDQLAKKKLWVNCVYFRCGTPECLSEERTDIENVFHEVKKTPKSCQLRMKVNDLTTVQSFVCEDAKI